MNTDQNHNSSKDHYYLLKENSEHGSDKFGYERNVSDDQNLAKMYPTQPQQVIHNYEAIDLSLKETPRSSPAIQQNLQYPSVPSLPPINQLQNIPNHPKGPHSFQPIAHHQPIIHNQPIIHHQPQPLHHPPYPSNPQRNIHIVVENANKNESVMYCQSVPCQKCGLVANGPLTLEKGKTVAAWATCLFITTGIFCFLPCVMDSCKDTWVGCPRCGHKRAVVKSAWCC